MNIEALRFCVYKSFVEHSRAPTFGELARDLAVGESAVREGLDALHTAREIVLAKDRASIRMAHPFSSEPMGFVVEGRGTMWWGGCAWDSFAIGAALKEPVTVLTRCPHCDQRIVVERDRDGALTGDSFVAHFLVPVRRFWDDVVHTCSNQRMFCNDGHIDAWLAARGFEEGARLRPGQLSELATRWYGGRLDEGGRRPTPEEARAHFGALDLVGPFWKVGI